MQQYDSVEKIARTAVDSATGLRAANALNGLASTVQLRGRLRDAERLKAQANVAESKARGNPVDPYETADFQATIDGLLRGDTKRGLAILDSTLQTTPATALASHSSDYLAWDYALLGNPARARDVLNLHLARLDTLGRRQEFVDLERVRGVIAMAEGKTDSALRYFRQSDSEPDGLPTGNCTACTPYMLGMVFDQGGHPDSARKYFTRFVEMPAGGHFYLDPEILGPTLFRLGQLYEQAGDTTHALQYYGRFVDLWKNADPDLQPRVAEAKARIAAINRAKG